MLAVSPGMHVYSLYGLCFHSEIVLPSARRIGGAADIRIVLRRLDDEELEREPSRSDRVWGSIGNELQFLVHGGEEIVIDNRAGIDTDRIAGYVGGVLLATLLRQRGLLTLHASAVARKGRAIAFVGDSGWGKSTLAAFFCGRGYELVNDDLLVVDPAAVPPLVLPGVPQLQLRDDVGNDLREDFMRLAPVCQGYDKRAVTFDRPADGASPLVRMYLLSPAINQPDEGRALPEKEALLALLRHSRATNLLTDPADLHRNFVECGTVARQIPMVQIERHPTADRLARLFDTIELELDRAPLPVSP